ncbi:hypothetical protein ACQJBY_017966 [Aegilops geniculata]
MPVAQDPVGAGASADTASSRRNRCRHMKSSSAEANANATAAPAVPAPVPAPPTPMQRLFDTSRKVFAASAPGFVPPPDAVVRLAAILSKHPLPVPNCACISRLIAVGRVLGGRLLSIVRFVSQVNSFRLDAL